MSPLTKYDTIVPNMEIHKIRFRDIDPDVQDARCPHCAFTIYNNLNCIYVHMYAMLNVVEK